MSIPGATLAPPAAGRNWFGTAGDGVLAPAAVAALGCGLVLAGAGAVGGDLLLGVGGVAAAVDSLLLLVVGVALAALALVLLMAGDWIDPGVVLILSLPLPALLASDALRLAPAAPVSAMVVAAWFATWGPSRRRLRAGELPLGRLLLFLGAYAFASLVSEHRATAAREMVNLLVLGGLLVALTDRLSGSEERTRRLLTAVAWVAGLAGMLAVLEAGGVIPGRFPEPSGLNRAALGFGQPNGLGMFLALCVPLVAHVRATARTVGGRGAAGLALAATVAGLIATLSRGSALSVLAGTLLLPLVGQWRTALRIWGAALLAAVLADVATGGVVRDTVAGVVTDWTVAQRAALMLAGIRLFLESPLAGIGPGAFAHELERAGVLVPTLWDLQATPHNAYIQVAVEAGLLGLVAFGALLAAVFVRLLRSARVPGLPFQERSLRMALLWGFGVVLAEGMVEWPLSHGQGQMVVLLVALGCARAAAAPTSAEPGGGAAATLDAEGGVSRDPALRPAVP